MYECLPTRILTSIFLYWQKTNINKHQQTLDSHLTCSSKAQNQKTTSEFITIWPPQLILHHQNLEQQIKNDPKAKALRLWGLWGDDLYLRLHDGWTFGGLTATEVHFPGAV